MKHIPVSDPFGAGTDPSMPWLGAVLDPAKAMTRLQLACTRFVDEAVELCAIRVTRHKPSRRCVVEYDFESKGASSDASSRRQAKFTLLGKVRAKGLDKRTAQLVEALSRAEFEPDSADGISVPEVAGIIPEFRMWLQLKVPGVPATDLLAQADGAELARRIADAAHKVHATPIAPERNHTIGDELRILSDRLSLLAKIKPGWAPRLQRVLEASVRLGGSLRTPQPCGIHRDFYPAQILVDVKRLWLLDFDLFCKGDPALDIGNFIGHLTEQSLRRFGDANALVDRERAMEDRFVELSGEETRPRTQAYQTLTLVRLIQLSTEFAERRPFTERLLQLCEQRLEL